MNDTAKAVLGCMGLPVLLAFEVLWPAFVLLRLWHWFAVPFYGAPFMSWPMAVGTLLIVSVAGLRYTRYEGQEYDFAGTLTELAIKPALILAVGWFTTLFMEVPV